ncbi:unnamed protein product [Triticum turgidum subsp. durum]|uniref:Malectin-like domain-containing protein n=1 Tax=Triticum turgidum subsp. durum TaxID=4567 RepID=A0A9R0RBH3_TRITD|nr:unnamed protein product [Triticum turgidum subsp. durum]
MALRLCPRLTSSQHLTQPLSAVITFLHSHSTLTRASRLCTGSMSGAKTFPQKVTRAFTAPGPMTPRTYLVALATLSKDDNLTISYTSKVPNYTAPVDVYGTARSMGPIPQINLNYNLTWILPVDGGFFYLLRFHFCEIQHPITKVNQRVFFIYINNQTAAQQMDVIVLSGGIGRTLYTDYVIMSTGSGQVDMWIALHPDLSVKLVYFDAILNGLEVFKLQGYGVSNLAGHNPPDARKPEGDMQAAISGTAGGFAFILIALFSTCVICRRKKAAKSSCKTDYGHRPTERKKSTCDIVHRFSFAEIQVATKDFDGALIIGRGGFGNVYIGDIDGGTKVAIKRCNQKSQQGFHEFQTEIEMLCNF